jgi:HD-like signal output (HDOD) protein/CheY-like chemotaxis protein
MYDSTPQILLVSNDSETINSLQDLFHGEQWQCNFVNTVIEAEEMLHNTTIDLALTCSDIPLNGGFDLLTKIKQQSPDTIRLFLTSFVDSADTINALSQGIAQQIISNPWIDQELKEIIRSALRQRKQQKKYSSDFQCLVNNIPLLPPIPESYANILTCVSEENINIEKMSDYISQDVAISAILLRWANSALFGQRFMVDTVKRAIIVLGTQIVETLVLSESLNRSIIQHIPQIKGFNLESFKKHTMATAVLTRLLVKSTWPNDTELQDRAFVAGLLHDCGKLILGYYMSDKFEASIMQSKLARIPLLDAEQSIYQSNHSEIGAFLTEWWALPSFIVNVNLWHHTPDRAPNDRDIVTAAHVANLLSYQLNYGSSEEMINRDIAPEYIDKFVLNEEAIEILKTKTDSIIQALSQP